MAKIVPISGVDDRVALADAIPLSSPFTLNVFPTNACNFRCAYCAQSLDAAGRERVYGLDNRFMDMDTMALVVAQSRRFAPYKLLSFMGHGEPLLNRSLPAMVKLARDAGIAKRIEIITNASVLTNALADALINAGLTNLRVSLQGLDADAYRATSNVNIDFEQYYDRLKYFYRHKSAHMGLYIKVMDISLPEHGEEQFYKMFGGICDKMYVEKVQPVYHAVQNHANNEIMQDRYGNAHAPRTVCPLVFYSLAVWPDGSVQPCDAIYKPRLLGNVKSASLWDMWHGEAMNRFRKEHLERKKNTLEGCKNCCAPDDVSHPADVLDGREEALLHRLPELRGREACMPEAFVQAGR